MRCLILGLTAVALSWSPLQAERLQFPTWERILDRSDPGPQRLCAYQNGRMVTLNKEGTAVRIENLLDGTSFERVMKSFPSGRQVVNAIAVSFEGHVAVGVSRAYLSGFVESNISWYGPDGALERVIPTGTLPVREMGFVGDGSLWCIGMEQGDTGDAPRRGVLRQYDASGKVIAKIPWTEPFSFSRSYRLPDARLYTSRNYFASTSHKAGSWHVMWRRSLEQHWVSHKRTGSINVPEGFEFRSGAVTDSGRLFVQGFWMAGSNDNRDPAFQDQDVFELVRQRDRSQPAARKIEKVSDKVFGKPPPAEIHLVGSEGDDLVFTLRSPGRDTRVVQIPVN